MTFHARTAAAILASLLATVTSSNAVAQGPTPQGPPNSGTPSEDPFSGFSTALDISTEESKAKSSFSLSGFFSGKRVDGAEAGPRLDKSWKVSLSIPIGGKSDLLDKGTLASLGDGTKLSAGITLLSFRPNPSAIANRGFLDLMEQAKHQCSLDAGSDEDKKQACEKLLPAENVIRTYTPWLTLQMNRALYSGFWTLGAEGAVSVARYSHIEAATLDEKKDRELGYSGKLAFNYYFPDAVSKFKLEGEYSDAAKAAKSTVVCKPDVVTPADDCKPGAATGPTREDALIVRTGYARYFPFRTGKAGIGVELLGSKDVLSADWAVEVPVYVTFPGTTLISPGVKVSYGSKDGEKDLTANLFVKTAFSF